MELVTELQRVFEDLDAERARHALMNILAPLQRHDEGHGSDLVHTLKAYVRHGAHMSATAEALFLHRNSVLYRLQRIEDISGLEVRHPEVRGTLYIAWALTEPYFLQAWGEDGPGRENHEGKR